MSIGSRDYSPQWWPWPPRSVLVSASKAKALYKESGDVLVS